MLNWILSTSALIAVILLVRRLLRGRMDPRLTCALWLLAALRVLIPVQLFSAPVSVSGLAERTGAAEAVEAARYETRLETAYASGASGSGDDGGLSALQTRENWGWNVTDVEISRVDAPDEETGGDASGREDVRLEVKVTRDRFLILRIIRYAGTAAVAGWFLAVNLRFSRRLRRARRVWEGELPLPCPLPVYTAAGLPSPCLFGLFRPAIYLTPEAAREERLEHVLAHELTHFRRRDNWWAVLRCVCLAAQWFNPLVWLAARMARQDCELACDVSAIRRLGEEQRLAYGRTLVEMIDSGRNPGALMCTATTMTSGINSIRERITLIAKKPRMTAATLLTVLLIALLAVGCTFGGAGTDGEPADDPSTAETDAPQSTGPEIAEADGVFSHLYGRVLSDDCTDGDCQALLDAVLAGGTCAELFRDYTSFSSADGIGVPLADRLAPYLAQREDYETLQQLLLLMDSYSGLYLAGSYARDAGDDVAAMNTYFLTPGINGFLCSLYSEALEADLSEAFYIGYGEHVATSAEEDCPRYRLTCDEISRVLWLRLGLDVDGEWIRANFPWEYDPAEDAFFHAHGDTNMRIVVCYHLEQKNGLVSALCCVEGFGLTTVRLIPSEDEGYQFLSHTETFRAQTAAELAETVYRAIAGSDSSRDFYLTVEDYLDETEVSLQGLHITAENGSGLPESLSVWQWREPDASSTCECAVTAAITLSTPDGSVEMTCYEESCGTVTVTADGITRRFLAETDGGESLFDCLLRAADQALVSGLADGIVIDGSVSDCEKVTELFARRYAARIAELPDWSSSRPEKVVFGGSGVTGTYSGEGTETFTAWFTLYFPSGMETSAWQAGSGMTEITQGEYAGWWAWTTGAGFARTGQGDWMCTGQYTGGESFAT